jgi:hypothetical protein
MQRRRVDLNCKPCTNLRNATPLLPANLQKQQGRRFVLDFPSFEPPIRLPNVINAFHENTETERVPDFYASTARCLCNPIRTTLPIRVSGNTNSLIRVNALTCRSPNDVGVQPIFNGCTDKRSALAKPYPDSAHLQWRRNPPTLSNNISASHESKTVGTLARKLRHKLMTFLKEKSVHEAAPIMRSPLVTPLTSHQKTSQRRVRVLKAWIHRRVTALTQKRAKRSLQIRCSSKTTTVGTRHHLALW